MTFSHRRFMKIRTYMQLGWSGCAMVLGKLPVPGRPPNLDNSMRVRVVVTFFSLVYYFSSSSLSL